jgi:4-amino-4-deoxy-L-arabinose transferase-like glycosyltransferase
MFQGKPALPSERYSSVRAGLFTAFLLLFIVCTRWASAPRRLYYFDSANFALSLERFDPALHQPQPPGYPFFVLLIRLIHLWVVRPETVLLIAGIVAAVAATILIRFFAIDLFGRPAGMLAAALLASNPVFWFGGVTNQIRLFLSLSAIGISLLAWRALKTPNDARWFYSACAALGIAAGFRPVESVLLVPLLMYVWWRTGRSLSRLAIGAAALFAVVVPWVVATVIAAGGWQSTISILWQYANEQFSGSSAVFGAPATSAWFMFKEAFVWNLLGVIAWIWAVPFVIRRAPLGRYTEQAAFAAIAFFPAFLFSAFIHIGDPDQALASISILCALGGGVLAAQVRRTNGRAVSLAVIIIAVNALLFFEPFNKLSKAASYRTVTAVDRMNTDALGAIAALRRDQSIAIVDYGSLVASRHLEYYFPEDYVIVLPGTPAHPIPGQSVQMFYRHAGLSSLEPATGRMPKHTRRVVCLLPMQSRPSDLPGWRHFGPVFYKDLPNAGTLQIGPYTLIRDAE